MDVEETRHEKRASAKARSADSAHVSLGKGGREGGVTVKGRDDGDQKRYRRGAQGHEAPYNLLKKGESNKVNIGWRCMAD